VTLRCWNYGEAPPRPPPLPAVPRGTVALSEGGERHDLTMTPVRRPATSQPPKRRLGVRAMSIDFGSAAGRVRTDEARAR
jgi:hypothetical protein